MLAGCGLAREAQLQREQEAKYKETLKACATMQPVRWAQCQTEAENQYFGALKNSAYGDLLTLKQAKRAEIASRLQSGQITKAQADVELASLNSQLVSEAQRRQATNRIAAAQESAAAAASMSAAAMSQPQSPAPVT
jgi:hypothetical protein